jgi:hypothetical protein
VGALNTVSQASRTSTRVCHAGAAVVTPWALHGHVNVETIAYLSATSRITRLLAR